MERMPSAPVDSKSLPNIKSNLPARRYRRLIGRDVTVRQALSLLVTGARNDHILIHGPAGSGKTCIALEIGHRILEASRVQEIAFESLVWLSASPAILTADGVLRSPLVCGTFSDFITNVCAALDRADILRALPEQQPALLHAALAEHPALIIADDLDEVVDERVASFLKSLPHRCRVLATSRSQLDFGNSIRVDPLTFEQVGDLVRDISEDAKVDYSESEVKRLHELCGGIPLAIVWVVNLRRLGFNINYVLENFDQSSTDLLRFCFFKAWESIKGSAAGDLLVAVALFSAGVQTRLAYRAAGPALGVPALEQAVVRLRRLGLVEVSSDRLSLLPMTRTYIMGSVLPPPSESDGIDARGRWLESLAEYVAESLALPRWQDCFDRLELERINLEELLSWAQLRQNDALYFRAAVLYSDLSYYLFSRAHWRQLVEHGSWALPALRDQGLGEEYLTVLLTWVARVHMLHGDDVRLRECFSMAEDFMRTVRADDRPLYQAIVDYNRASHLRGEHSDPQVAPTLRRVAETFRSLGRDEWYVRALNRLGNMLSASGDFDAAIETFMEVVDVAAGHLGTAWGKDMTGIGKGNLGILANRQGHYQQAIDLLHQSQALVAQAMDGAVALMELAIAHYHLGDRDEAISYGIAARAVAVGLDLGISIAESDPLWEKDILPGLLATEGLPEEVPSGATPDDQRPADDRAPDGLVPGAELEGVVQQAIEGGLLEVTEEELEEQLGLQLRELLLQNATVSGEAPEWGAGDYGPANLARRFIAFEAESIRLQICQRNGKGLKPEYARLLAPGGARAGAISSAAAGLLAMFHLTAPVVAVPAVAVYMTLWLLHANLERFCQGLPE